MAHAVEERAPRRKIDRRTSLVIVAVVAIAIVVAALWLLLPLTFS